MMFEIISGVLVNVISTFVVAVIILLTFSIYPIIRRLKSLKELRKLLHPSNRVFISLYTPDEIIYDQNKIFKSIYTEEEKSRLLSGTGNKNSFDGAAVRLDSISNEKVYLSRAGFYDFLTSNLILKPSSNNIRTLRNEILSVLYDDDYKKLRALENRLKIRVLQCGKLKSFDDVLRVKELANITAVSVFLEDCNDNILLVKRGNKVAVSSGNFAVASSGTVTPEDCGYENPFIACAERELKEELGIQALLKIQQIVISRQKLQPVVLLHGKLQSSFSDLSDIMRKAPDFREENTSVFSVPKKESVYAVRQYQFTDVAAYQIALVCGIPTRLQYQIGIFHKVDLTRYQLL